jgi:hypothetical protein
VPAALTPKGDRGRRPATWLIWSLLVLVAALLVLAVVPFTLANDALAATKKAELVASVVAPLAFVVVGAVVVSRRPGNTVGWLCCAVGLGQSLATFGGQGAAAILATDPGQIPGGLVLHQLGSLAWELSWVSLSLLLLLFPNGRLPSRRWRPAVWVVIAAAGAALTVLFLPGPASPGLPANPLGVEPLGAALRFAYDAGYALLAAVVLAIVSLVARFRQAAGAERQQLKWFAYGTSMLALLGVLAAVTGEQGVEGVAGPVAGALVFPVLVSGVPVAIGVAVLRYRLYDIDRLINRTLVYSLLTAVLGAGYAGVVLVLGQLFGGVTEEPPSWVVAAATLAVAALFQPARRRIQAVVDRRFNRRRYDAAKTVEAFSAHLQDEVDLDTLSAELLAVVDRTMQPTTAFLWLRPTSSPPRRTGT